VGYNVTADCKPKEVVEKCILPINAKCTKELNPQVCGSLQCKYNNPCLAESVGYNVTADCKPKEVVEKCSLPKKRKCSKKKNLQVCGSLQCKYKNKCLAKTAGYNAKADCKPVEVVEKCSLPKKRKCSKKKNLQVCGSLQCKYKNKCLAKTAGHNAKADCKPVEVAEKCSLPKKKRCGNKKDPQVCGGLQCKYKNPCLAKTAGYNVTSDCGPKADNTEVCPANQPAPNSIGCTLSESVECKYGEETCCPNGGAEKTFASLIAQCYKNEWIVRSTDACFNPDSECKGKTEECPANQPAPNSIGCTLSESVKCKYGEETCCPKGGAEKTFPSIIARCYKNQWIVRYTDACSSLHSNC